MLNSRQKFLSDGVFRSEHETNLRRLLDDCKEFFKFFNPGSGGAYGDRRNKCRMWDLNPHYPLKPKCPTHLPASYDRLYPTRGYLIRGGCLPVLNMDQCGI